MKIYIQHNDNEPLFPVGLDAIADYITPEDWCEVDKDNCELEMDHQNRVYISFASFDVNPNQCERDLERAIKCVLDNMYDAKSLRNINNNQ